MVSLYDIVWGEPLFFYHLIIFLGLSTIIMAYKKRSKKKVLNPKKNMVYKL